MGGDESYLDFIEYDRGHCRTQRWRVKHVEGDDDLGIVKWYPPWRRYCFFPESDTLFDENCLREIHAFIIQEMAARKERGPEEGKAHGG